MNETLRYYNNNAELFNNDTKAAQMGDSQKRFLKYIPEGGKLLDLGCGSGRDSLAFKYAGYKVTAVDGSTEICKIAEKLIGQPVIQMLFEDIDYESEFDGIWACASILHVPSNNLPDILTKVIRALKQGGHAYLTFKYGDFEGERSGRYYTDLTEESLHSLLDSVGNNKIVEEWISADVRAGRDTEKWLNVVVKK